MRVYADSSFILRLVTGDPGTPEAVAAYRQLGRRQLFYLQGHALEVENAIRQRAFHERSVRPSNQRVRIKRERDVALAQLNKCTQRGALLEVTLDQDETIGLALQVSARQTERLGARAIDVLHLASALLLESELFLTFDARRLALAKAEGMNARTIQPGL